MPPTEVITPPFPGYSDGMTDYIRATVSHWLSTDPKLDRVTNTFHFSASLADPMADTDWNGLANDLMAAYKVGAGDYIRGSDKVGVKLYDLEDAEPRMPKASVESSVGFLAAGVREVAVCLSFRGPQSTARQRGRVFLGPWPQSYLNERVPEGARTSALALATRLANLGGANVDWSVYSPTTRAAGGSLADSFHPVRLAWVDDSWDTQRSRGLPPTLKTSQTHSE